MKVTLKRKQANTIENDVVEEHDHDHDDREEWHVEPVADDGGAFVGFFLIPMGDDEDVEAKPRRRRRV